MAVSPVILITRSRAVYLGLASKGLAIWLLLPLLTLASKPGFSEAGITATKAPIATFLLPGLIEKDNNGELTGLFFELAKQLVEQSGLPLKIIELPSKRAKLAFHSDEIIGYFPSTTEMLGPTAHKFCRTSAFADKTDFVFFREGTKIPSSLADLNGSDVAITAGYPFSEKLLGEKKINLIRGISDETCMKMLHLGRVDYFVIEELTGVMALQKLGFKNIRYNPDFPVGSQDVFFTFQGTEPGLNYCHKFDELLKQRIATGQWLYAQIKKTRLQQLEAQSFKVRPP